MRALAWLAVAALTGCAVAPIPENAPVGTPVSEDERGIFRLSEEYEKQVASSGRLVRAPALEAYLLEVAKRLHPADVVAAARFRFRVASDRTPNAWSLPHGLVIVSTGLLARVEDEAELAAVLAHETAHVVRRHKLLEERLRAGTFTGPSGRSEFSQEHEREADRDSVAALARGGYRPAAVRSALEKLAAWDKAEKIKDPKYPSHPPDDERIAAVGAQAAALSPGGTSAPEAYGAHVAEILLVNARLEMAAARYEWARVQVERYLALRPRSAVAFALLGEIARREAANGFEATALDAYRKAVALDPQLAEGWRGVGLVLQKAGDDAGARRAFTRYLELAPEAPDRGHVRAYLDSKEERASP